MYRNTYLVVSVLAVLAALVVGVNIGKKLQSQPPTQKIAATPTPTPGIIMQPYEDTFCGFSVSYPSIFTVMENASGSAILNNTTDKTQSIVLTCQKNIPRPPLTPDKIESLTLATSTGASISAKLYHDASAKDGTPIDAIIFHHPKNGMDIFIAG